MKKVGSSLKLAKALQIAPELAEVQAFMPIDPADYENLKADIEKNGIRDPLKVYQKDGQSFLIAGFNRVKIAQELNITDPLPVDTYKGTPAEYKELAIIDNLNRRHLTIAQKKKIAEYLIIADPKTPARQIAKKTGLTDKTAGKVKADLERRAEIPHVDKVTDSKGRKQQAKKPVKISNAKTALAVKIPAAPDETPEKKAAIFINNFYRLDLDIYQLKKITLAVIGEALTRIKGTDRAALIKEIKKMLK